MKKLTAFLSFLCLTITLTACSSQTEEVVSDHITSQSTIATEQTQVQEESDNSANQTEIITEMIVEDTDVPADNSDTDAEDQVISADEDSTDSKEILVAYFSCTGNTEGIAGHIINVLAADSYEIVPEQPYSDDDLNYNDSASRSTIEQNDDSARPAISGSVENMEDYDIVFIGYPIWWGQAPKIMYTFMESYDFSGKTIVPFCTSGSSGVGSSADNLHSSASDSANWLDGTRFNSDASQSEIEEWISGLPFKVTTQ